MKQPIPDCGWTPKGDESGMVCVHSIHDKNEFKLKSQLVNVASSDGWSSGTPAHTPQTYSMPAHHGTMNISYTPAGDRGSVCTLTDDMGNMYTSAGDGGSRYTTGVDGSHADKGIVSAGYKMGSMGRNGMMEGYLSRQDISMCTTTTGTQSSCLSTDFGLGFSGTFLYNPSLCAGGNVDLSMNPQDGVYDTYSISRGCPMQDNTLPHTPGNDLQAQNLVVNGYTQHDWSHMSFEVHFDCLDNLIIHHEGALISATAHLAQEDEYKNNIRTCNFFPYQLPKEELHGYIGPPLHFVDMQGATLGLFRKEEEFLNIKILEEKDGNMDVTGFVKLQFSSLQEIVPMKVDVVDAQGGVTGFLILRFVIVNPDTKNVRPHAIATTPNANALTPSHIDMQHTNSNIISHPPTHNGTTQIVHPTGSMPVLSSTTSSKNDDSEDDCGRLPSLPSNRPNGFKRANDKNVNEKKKVETKLKQRGSRQGGVFGWAGRWCCDAPQDI